MSSGSSQNPVPSVRRLKEPLHSSTPPRQSTNAPAKPPDKSPLNAVVQRRPPGLHQIRPSHWAGRGAKSKLLRNRVFDPDGTESDDVYGDEDEVRWMKMKWEDRPADSGLGPARLAGWCQGRVLTASLRLSRGPRRSTRRVPLGTTVPASGDPVTQTPLSWTAGPSSLPAGARRLRPPEPA